MLEDLMMLEGGDVTTYNKLDLIAPNDGFTSGAPPKGIFIDCDAANVGTYEGVYKDVYGNEFTVKVGHAPDNDGSVNTLILPIQISHYISETSGGGRFSDAKAYALY
tara:strand:- start:548 stop:868 length:321 start_codon:yes stop_codon:yes gene_type:complete